MKRKHVTGRELRRGTPEENLAPGESIVIRKKGGKVFELRRIDPGAKSMNAALDKLFQEMPPTGPRERVDLARIIIKDRE